jgi:peptidoglycan hydrolase-like amidase
LDCQKKIADCQHAWDLMEQAKKPHEESLKKMEQDLANFQARIKQIEQELIKKEKEIKKGEETLSFQEELLAKRVHQYYIRSYYDNPLVYIFSQKNAGQILRELAYQQAVTNQDKESITDVVLYIKDLEDRKKTLQQERQALASLKAETDKRAESVRKLLAEATTYQKTLEVSISSLSTKQQEILSAKAEVFQTSVGEVPPADDPAASPNFNPGFSPAFAAFSFGAPHRKGMSQFGALGRAQAGQSEEEILKAYYGNIRIETKDMPGQINTDQGRKDFETNYLYGIAEMPSSWDQRALRAQAIAARTYALSYVGWRLASPNAGGSICTSESCQVYSSSKAGSPSSSWREAVDQTKGKIIVSNQTNELISAWYASTAGGYTFSYTTLGHSTPGLWDTPQGRSGWTSQAYEKIARWDSNTGSPWFYKAWYKERGGATCGRSHPWLTSEEFTDILNAWVVFSKGSDEDKKHVTPTDTGCWGGEPYSISQMRDKAQGLGGSYSSVSSVSVDYSSDGFTNSVKLQTNQGELSISGPDFKTIFNLRAPGKISLKSSLFNIEKK